VPDSRQRPPRTGLLHRPPGVPGRPRDAALSLPFPTNETTALALPKAIAFFGPFQQQQHQHQHQQHQHQQWEHVRGEGSRLAGGARKDPGKGAPQQRPGSLRSSGLAGGRGGVGGGGDGGGEGVDGGGGGDRGGDVSGETAAAAEKDRGRPVKLVCGCQVRRDKSSLPFFLLKFSAYVLGKVFYFCSAMRGLLCRWARNRSCRGGRRSSAVPSWPARRTVRAAALHA